MNKIKTFPILYKTGSKGSEQQWEIKVVPINNSLVNIVTEHGQVDGKIQTATVQITKGKNIGKKNETSPYEQACSEAESKWKKQLDKGYSEERGGGLMNLKPMLALKYEDKKDSVTFPAYIQPKLDGVRAIAVRNGDKISLLSRQGKEHLGLDHIKLALLQVMTDGAILDGELYIHKTPFQELISLVKKPQVGSEVIKYHIYDFVDELSFEKRQQIISQVLKNRKSDSCLVPVTTFEVKSNSEIDIFYQKCIEDGYEGAMLRWSDKGYKSGYRSDSLLKIKSFQDEEFEIVDVVPGIGREEDKGTFVCKTKDGTIFNCRPKGDDVLRAEYLKNKKHCIGKYLTVKFFEWTTSDNPVPRFPVGISIRDYE